MPVPPVVRDAIVAALRELGPMSAVEIAEVTGLPRGKVDGAIARTRKSHPGKFFRVSRWRDQSGRQGREIPIYAAATGKDADRPVFDDARRKALNRRNYRENRSIRAAQRRRRIGSSASPWAGLITMETRA